MAAFRRVFSCLVCCSHVCVRSAQKINAACRRELSEAFGITFSRLFALNNMPIKRYVDYLRQRGQLEEYMQLLVTSFNVAAAEVCCTLLADLLDFTH